MFTTDHGFKDLGKVEKDAESELQADDAGAFLTSIPIDSIKDQNFDLTSEE